MIRYLGLIALVISVLIFLIGLGLKIFGMVGPGGIACMSAGFFAIGYVFGYIDRVISDYFTQLKDRSKEE